MKVQQRVAISYGGKGLDNAGTRFGDCRKNVDI